MIGWGNLRLYATPGQAETLQAALLTSASACSSAMLQARVDSHR
jgi:hypothetical protein